MGDLTSEVSEPQLLYGPQPDDLIEENTRCGHIIYNHNTPHSRCSCVYLAKTPMKRVYLMRAMIVCGACLFLQL